MAATQPGFSLSSHGFKLTFLGLVEHGEEELKGKKDWSNLMHIVLQVFEDTGINVYLLENRFNR